MEEEMEIPIPQDDEVPNGVRVTGDTDTDTEVVDVDQDQQIQPVDSEKQDVLQNDQAVQPAMEQTKECDKHSESKTEKLELRCKPVVDDQVPGPSRLSHLSTRRMARVKKREFEKMPIADSSDSDYEEPAPAPKKTRRGVFAVPPVPKPKSKTKTATLKSKPATVSPRGSRGPLSRRKVNEAEAVMSPKNSDSGAPNYDYWKFHDIKDDAKLKIKPCVVIQVEAFVFQMLKK